jgi:hypothetical protein
MDVLTLVLVSGAKATGIKTLVVSLFGDCRESVLKTSALEGKGETGTAKGNFIFSEAPVLLGKCNGSCPALGSCPRTEEIKPLPLGPVGHFLGLANGSARL